MSSGLRRRSSHPQQKIEKSTAMQPFLTELKEYCVVGFLDNRKIKHELKINKINTEIHRKKRITIKEEERL